MYVTIHASHFSLIHSRGNSNLNVNLAKQTSFRQVGFIYTDTLTIKFCNILRNLVTIWCTSISVFILYLQIFLYIRNFRNERKTSNIVMFFVYTEYPVQRNTLHHTTNIAPVSCIINILDYKNYFLKRFSKNNLTCLFNTEFFTQNTAFNKNKQNY